MATLELVRDLRAACGHDAVDDGDDIRSDDLKDESLHPREVRPAAVVRPRCTSDVVAVVDIARRYHCPLTPRGSGTGLSGGAVPVNGGVVVSFRAMDKVLTLNERDHVAVVQPGITLRELDEVLAPTGLRYPVYPGELSGSLGGNVNTNAGGMRAVRHGVTRRHVLGLEFVLMSGAVVRSGGAIMKSSSGYDLTQLVVGSEGTLALVTEITLQLSPQLPNSATVLAPFSSVAAVADVVPGLISSGLAPSILEYVDVLAMAGMTRTAELELGVAADVAAATVAYLIIVLETRTEEQLALDMDALAGRLDEAGALEVYVLPGSAAVKLIDAREKVFWTAKSSGAHDIIDIVVPRSQIPNFLATAHDIGSRHGGLLAGCGHVGDGNVHLSIFQPDEERRNLLLHDLYGAGVTMGGAISGEHGVGRDKQAPFLEFADPGSLALQRAIKNVFDPDQLLNPYRLLDERPLP